uniref:Uncharacterized protein n=1 Tax=Mycena chlorophos TaxID=658473 RepID=A0ABQ0L792_MYCCL|nr:predicted protein [Mycena chlorophos]
MVQYYEHACDLGKIIKLCLRWEIKHSEIDRLEAMIVDWVRKYEEYYYQLKPERLAVCTLTIHDLLHVADDIRNCGPSWTTWTFMMERFCGFLQHGLHSRKRPHANISRRLMHLMYLEQIGLRYNLTNELAIFKPLHKELTKNEQRFPLYPRAILGSPREAAHTPSDLQRRGIAQYMVDVLDNPAVSVHRLEQRLPLDMPRWAMVRIAGGDRIRAAWKRPRNIEELRDNTFIRVSLLPCLARGN